MGFVQTLLGLWFESFGESFSLYVVVVFDQNDNEISLPLQIQCDIALFIYL